MDTEKDTIAEQDYQALLAFNWDPEKAKEVVGESHPEFYWDVESSKFIQR